MTSTVFVNQTTQTDAAWFNDVNKVVYTATGTGTVAPSTAADVRTNLGLTASTGSSLVGYKAGGTGAITTQTLQTVVQRQWINVRDYGAVGDGTTDDTAALQAAHTYAASASNSSVYGNSQVWLGHEPVVYYPMGLYKITSAISIAGTQVIVGCGGGTSSMSKISQGVDGINIFRLVAGTDGNTNSTCIENMTFKSGSASSAANAAQISVAAGLTGTNSIYIRNCWFQNPETYAIDIQQGDDIQITGCTFDVCAYNAIRLAQGNTVTNCRIVGNDFFQVTLSCILTYTVNNLVVSNNTIEACGSGITSYFLNTVSTLGVTVTGNTFRTFNGTFVVLGVSGTPANAVNAVISNNSGNFSTTTSVFVNGFGIGFVYNSVIAGNSIKVPTGIGPIIIDNGTSKWQNCAIQGNVFLSDGGNSTTCITLSSALSKANKINNNVYIAWTTPESINLAGQNGANNTTISGTISPGSVASVTTYTSTLNVSGAQVGDFVDVRVSNGTDTTVLTKGLSLYGFVSSAGVVTIAYCNPTAGAVVIPDHTVYVATRARAV